MEEGRVKIINIYTNKKIMAIENLEEELEDTEIISENEKRKKELLEKVVKFTEIIRKKYLNLIKSVVVFGSVARGDLKKHLTSTLG